MYCVALQRVVAKSTIAGPRGKSGKATRSYQPCSPDSYYVWQSYGCLEQWHIASAHFMDMRYKHVSGFGLRPWQHCPMCTHVVLYLRMLKTLRWQLSIVSAMNHTSFCSVSTGSNWCCFVAQAVPSISCRGSRLEIHTKIATRQLRQGR